MSQLDTPLMPGLQSPDTQYDIEQSSTSSKAVEPSGENDTSNPSMDPTEATTESSGAVDLDHEDVKTRRAQVRI